MLNVTSPDQCKGCPSASVNPTGPGYVIISAGPKCFSTSFDITERVLDMSKLAFHSKALLPVEALGIIWSTGGISNLSARLLGSAPLLRLKLTSLFVGCTIKVFLEIDRVCIFSARSWYLHWLWSGNTVACASCCCSYFARPMLSGRPCAVCSHSACLRLESNGPLR